METDNFNENIALELNNVSTYLQEKDKKTFLIRNISFKLEAGKTTAFIGESGAGKTSLANTILRILPNSFQTTGSIIFENEDILTLSEKRLSSIRGSKISMIFQDPGACLNPVFTIGRQLSESLVIHLNMDYEEAKEESIKLLNKVGIPRAERAFETYPHELSGGMKQRVMIAIAISCTPKILIADEPTTALDLTIQKEILVLLKNLQKETCMTQLFISHDIGCVAEMADFVAVMYDSEIVEFGPAMDVFNLKAHPYTKSLFSALLTHEMRKKQLPITFKSNILDKKSDKIFINKPVVNKLKNSLESSPSRFFVNKNKTHWVKR